MASFVVKSGLTNRQAPRSPYTIRDKAALPALQPDSKHGAGRLSPNSADKASESAVVLEDTFLSEAALETRLKRAYEEGYKAGYRAGANVKVVVDLAVNPEQRSNAATKGEDQASGTVMEATTKPEATPAQPTAKPVAAQATTTRPKDSVLRSAVKGLVWRVFSFAATVTITLVLLHNVIKVEDALEIGAFEFVAKYTLYFVHERLWTFITFI